MKLYKVRKYDTDIHILEFNPVKENLILTSTGDEKRTILSKIKHTWFALRGYKLIAAWNGAYFNYTKDGKADTCGVDYRDRGAIKGDSTRNDAFMEAIWMANKLYIDDIIIQDIPLKYKTADWAMSLGYTLIIDGEINIKKNEKFDHPKYPNPRTMLAQRIDGTVVIAVTDGRTSNDKGLTAVEQAQVMKQLNVWQAINCDGGGSTELVVEGHIINQLSGGERAIAQAFLVYGKEGYKLEKESVKFIYPCDSRRITSKYGPRGNGFHNGVDFGAIKPGVEGDPIYAAADGVVKVAKCNSGGIKKGYGYYYIIEHDGYCTLYGHLQKLELKVGQKVKQGQIVGHMGNTGSSTGAHLHFEIRKGKHDWRFFTKYKSGQFKSSLDPLSFLPERKKYPDALKLEEANKLINQLESDIESKDMNILRLRFLVTNMRADLQKVLDMKE